MKDKRAAIIHFLPLELYPPVMNDINAFTQSLNGYSLLIYTTKAYGNLNKFSVNNINVTIKRVGFINSEKNVIIRYVNYFFFYLVTTIDLILKRPKTILYFETLSSFPAYLYKTFFKKDSKIFIHYHEYITKKEYDTGMKLNKIFHQKEMKLYPDAEWISHTNSERLSRFISDIKPITAKNAYVLPNYPPQLFYCQAKSKITLPVRVLYVGALSMDTMYSYEFANWVISKKGNVMWDIYSWNITNDAKQFLQSLGTRYISLKNPVNYDQLKNVLPNYDVGIILYKGHNQNYLFNAPNKLFEYFVCGLDVWFSETLHGCLPYTTESTYPKRLAINFLKLNDLDINDLINREGQIYKQNNPFCEEAILPLHKKYLSII